MASSKYIEVNDEILDMVLKVSESDKLALFLRNGEEGNIMGKKNKSKDKKKTKKSKDGCENIMKFKK